MWHHNPVSQQLVPAKKFQLQAAAFIKQKLSILKTSTSYCKSPNLFQHSSVIPQQQQYLQKIAISVDKHTPLKSHYTATQTARTLLSYSINQYIQKRTGHELQTISLRFDQLGQNSNFRWIRFYYLYNRDGERWVAGIAEDVMRRRLHLFNFAAVLAIFILFHLRLSTMIKLRFTATRTGYLQTRPTRPDPKKCIPNLTKNKMKKRGAYNFIISFQYIRKIMT